MKNFQNLPTSPRLRGASKIAIVVEELTQLGGAERLLDAYLELFPKAPVFTLVWNKEKTLHRYDKFDIRPSFIQKLPLGSKKYKFYLPLMPKAVESFKLDDYDLVLSITSALVKGVITKKPTRRAEPSGRRPVHICYCNTPTRYLWFDSGSYIKNAPIPFFVRPLMPAVLSYLRKWDLKASKRPDFYIANSKNAQARITKYYHRQSDPIFPPVDAKKFNTLNSKIRPLRSTGSIGYYLLVSRIEPYKKVDLAIEAFKKLKLPLKIVGGGTRLKNYRGKASENIELVGRVSDDKLAKFYQNCEALIFPQEEDAGITPLEAMACGRPVIAYGKGGALESVVDGKTGVLFYEQTVESLVDAVRRFQKISFDQKTIRKHAEGFDKEVFKTEVLEYIKSKVTTTNYKKDSTKLQNTK